MKDIKIRKWNKERGLFEMVFELDNTSGEHGISTGNRDINGIPTYTGDIIEGDLQTPMGVIKRKGVVEFDLNHTQFVINFTGLNPIWGSNLPVNNVRIIGNVKTNPIILES